jgi:hypothetical protein
MERAYEVSIEGLVPFQPPDTETGGSNGAATDIGEGGEKADSGEGVTGAPTAGCHQEATACNGDAPAGSSEGAPSSSEGEALVGTTTSAAETSTATAETAASTTAETAPGEFTHFRVRDPTTGSYWTVSPDLTDCSCKDTFEMGLPCRHVLAVGQAYPWARQREGCTRMNRFFLLSAFEKTWAEPCQVPNLRRLAVDPNVLPPPKTPAPPQLRGKCGPKKKQEAPPAPIQVEPQLQPQVQLQVELRVPPPRRPSEQEGPGPTQLQPQVELHAPTAVQEQEEGYESGFELAESLLCRIGRANPGARRDVWVDEATREFKGLFLQLPMSMVSRPSFLVNATLFCCHHPETIIIFSSPTVLLSSCFYGLALLDR